MRKAIKWKETTTHLQHCEAHQAGDVNIVIECFENITWFEGGIVLKYRKKLSLGKIKLQEISASKVGKTELYRHREELTFVTLHFLNEFDCDFNLPTSKCQGYLRRNWCIVDRCIFPFSQDYLSVLLEFRFYEDSKFPSLRCPTPRRMFLRHSYSQIDRLGRIEFPQKLLFSLKYLFAMHYYDEIILLHRMI